MLNRSRRAVLMGTLVLMLSAVGTWAGDQRVVSFTCREMEVQNALRILQTVSALRVVVDPKVPHKRITLSLRDLPPEDALQTVVAAAGLSCLKLGNAYLVEPKEGGTLTAARARAALAAGGSSAGETAAPGSAGGIVEPDAPPPIQGSAGGVTQRSVPVPVAPAVLAALERPVDVDVKNGPLTAVMTQLSRSAGIQVMADPRLSEGLVATVGLHGIRLKNALEAVASETGLQISPRPDGVAFVATGLSLDAAQARARKAPAGARHVDQGQLWTAEWAHVLTNNFSAFDASALPHSLRRQSLHSDGRPLAFRPRVGGRGSPGSPSATTPHPTARGARRKPRAGAPKPRAANPE